MPTSRFWGYYDFLQRYYDNKPVDKRQAAIDKAKDLDWNSEIRKIKHDRR